MEELNTDLGQVKGIRVFSKGKYYAFEKKLNDVFAEDQSKIILDMIKSIMCFDPKISTYSENMRLCSDRRRKKLKEEGVSTYISTGCKTAYYKKKEKQRLLALQEEQQEQHEQQIKST